MIFSLLFIWSIFLYKAIMFNDTSSILWLYQFLLEELVKIINRLSNIGGNSNQETPLNVFSVSSRKGKVFYVQQVVCSIFHGFGSAEEKTFYSTRYVSKLQAIHNMFPKTLSESKNIPYTVRCTELWPKSQYNLEHYGLSNKITSWVFFFFF